MDLSDAHQLEGKTITVEQGKQNGYIEDNLNMVAKVISDRELTFRTIKAALMKIWGHPRRVSITDVGVNKLHRVPLHFMNKKAVMKVGMDLGFVIEVENPWRNGVLMRLGHAKRDCDFSTTMSLKDPCVPRYKPRLGVARAKSLNPYEIDDLQQNKE
ncbi:hypothetical protein PIB30_035624 [Stylosanthes scabra]|uniref:Uncharacterized protein n=1 Tax=Stylosanthes scabra TaxID=79078 RepID=A0ABU6YC48_9FABA|nr:hypothetical protein [Stylosanthes scabra]